MGNLKNALLDSGTTPGNRQVYVGGGTTRTRSNANANTRDALRTGARRLTARRGEGRRASIRRLLGRANG